MITYDVWIKRNVTHLDGVVSLTGLPLGSVGGVGWSVEWVLTDVDAFVWIDVHFISRNIT